MNLRFLMIPLLLSALSLAAPLTLSLPDSLMKISAQVTAQTMALRYDDAMALAKRLRSSSEEAGCVIENIVRVSRYDDLGDTAALIRAGENLENCEAQGLWDALRKFELGYVQSELGHSVKGALQTRSAAKSFEESKELESRAFYAIYAYYVDKSFSWLPFKSDRRAEYLAVLDSASLKSSRFWPLFLTPLVWMYYDKEDFAQGLKLADRGLARAPRHPVLVQIRADMLYRLKRYDEAASLYEQSAADYLRRTGKSIRYWCSVLNLIRIYHDRGDASRAKLWREKLSDPAYGAIRRWMPGSLIDDLSSRDLL